MFICIYGNMVCIPANMRRWPNVGLPLAHRLRRWLNSKPTLGQRLMFAGIPDTCTGAGKTQTTRATLQQIIILIHYFLGLTYGHDSNCVKQFIKNDDGLHFWPVIKRTQNRLFYILSVQCH